MDLTKLSDQQLEDALGYQKGPDLTKVSDADLQAAVAPADTSKEMQDAQWGAANPILRALQNTGQQAFVNPVLQATNQVTPVINAGGKLIGKNPNIPQLSTPAMDTAPLAAKVEGDIAGGVTQGGLATLAGRGNPLIGYPALAGIDAYGSNQPVVPAMLSSVKNAGVAMLAGKAGSSLASAAAKNAGGTIAKLAPRIGTALGMGTAGAAMAPAGSKVEAGASGAAFGALSPISPYGSKQPMTQAQLDAKVQSEGAPLYRQILNPGKGIINKVEVKSKGDIDDSMKLAAQNALPINSVEGKLDNIAAIEKTKAAAAPIYDQLNTILASNPEKQFNLQQIGDQVKASLAKSPNFKNAQELQAAQGKVDNEINAEILRHGTPTKDAEGNVTYDPHVDGQTLNMIKQGMWSKSYNPLEPNANDSSRAIGSSMREALEKAYPNDDVAGLNAKTGQYLQLQKILEATHGQVVQGGKIGKYAAQGAGMVTGGIVSAHLPLAGEVAGPLVGREIGQRVHQFMNDPSRLTNDWAKKLSNIHVIDQEPIKPEVMPSRPTVNNNQQKQISMNPVQGLPSPKDVPYNPSQHTDMNQGVIRQRSEVSEAPIEIPKLSRKLRAAYNPGQATFDVSQPMQTPMPGTPEHSQTFPQSQNISEFKNTEEAAAFGVANKNNPAMIQALNNYYKQGMNKLNEIRSKGKDATDDELSDAFLHSQKNQLYREAYEAATGTGGFKEPPPQGQGAPLSPVNPLATPGQGSTPQGPSNSVKALGLAATLGIASVFNPSTSQAQQVQDPERLKLPTNQYIMKNEGWKSMPYLDTNGNKTVGYGFKEGGMAWRYIPDAVKQGRRALTKSEGQYAFNQAYPQAVESAQKFCGKAWSNLSENQQKAITDMCYQMGSLHFPKLRIALEQGHYNTAAREILNSKYAKKDAPNRALQNAVLMQQ